jgi:hypothetical protein
MLFSEYEVQRCSRQCAATGRTLAEGEPFYSVLIARPVGLQRLDYAVESWAGPPDECVAWWRARVPRADEHRVRLAPGEVLLQLFLELEGRAEQAALRYVLGLLLMRRRIMRLEETPTDDAGRWLVLVHPRDESVHRVRVCELTDAQIEALQAEVSRLLFADAASDGS